MTAWWSKGTSSRRPGRSATSWRVGHAAVLGRDATASLGSGDPVLQQPRSSLIRTGQELRIIAPVDYPALGIR
jgi:hypothetical protein